MAAIVLVCSLFSVAAGAGAMLLDGHDRLEAQAALDREREGADAAAALSAIWHRTEGHLLSLSSALGDGPTNETFGNAVAALGILDGSVSAVRYASNDTWWQRPPGAVLASPLVRVPIEGGHLEASFDGAAIQAVLDAHAARLSPHATMAWDPQASGGAAVTGFGGAVRISQQDISILTVDRATLLHATGTGVAVAATSVMGAVIASSILVRPLRRMQDDARALAAGQAPAKRGGPKEFARLSASMRDAAAEVARERHDLQLVQERLGASLRRQTRTVADQEVRLRRLFEGISHDIKGPLITANVLLQQTRRDAKGLDERLDRAMVALDRLRGLVDQLGMLSRATTAPLHTVVDLGPLLKQAAQEAAAAVGPRARLVRLSGPKLVIRSDPERLRTAIRLLVDNALRHGGDTRITWHEGPVPTILILDQGPGFDFVPAMFEPFAVRSDKPGVAAGLGLAIAHRFIRSLGGGLQIHSDTTGTRCTVFLPGDR